jgi:hypothetical protein
MALFLTPMPLSLAPRAVRDMKLFPPETRPRQREVLIEIYRKGKIAEAFRAFKKIYLELVDVVIDHLESQEAGNCCVRGR